MRFSFLIIPIVCYMALYLTSVFINNALFYHILYYVALIILIIWTLIAMIRDATGHDSSLQIRLARSNNLMSYHLTNRSSKMVTVKNVYVTDVFRSKLYDIEVLGLAPELQDIPMSFSGIARGASLNGQFEDKKDACYFCVELKDGRRFFKIINSLF